MSDKVYCLECKYRAYESTKYEPLNDWCNLTGKWVDIPSVIVAKRAYMRNSCSHVNSGNACKWFVKRENGRSQPYGKG